ncbi:hypothetical protein LTR56_015195 [Elasticomyces elasticus]|nr:hypothetical protein LTR56_015195 [Elasticomyces elasticus]KAK3644489.1 hypothetical protein LTR22_015209 [Elasticomyces elasticus]KAK4915526.1 hypothetical protein LTR49_016373 [Elasticomyces elasticus]KAK5742174.1 hypothetical protein LTR17_003415 [Elasticomyces elasticus]KAK5756243.1 hypothetical protein LTS12_013667 [Elasticomyces elasticus]
MAQKAQKTQATRNSATLNRTHLISLGVYLSFLLIRTILFSRRLLPFALLNLPALAIEFWFERIGRPVYTETANGKELQKAGEALDAKGLTEWMWDVVYWSWGNTVLAALLGNWAWWLYAVVPLYSAWLAFSTYSGVRSGFSGMSAGAGGEGSGGAAAQSKRQAKLEKKGGQRMQYR